MDNAEPDTSSENIVPEGADKSFLGAITSKFQNLSASTASKTSENVKKKMDMVISSYCCARLFGCSLGNRLVAQRLELLQLCNTNYLCCGHRM